MDIMPAVVVSGDNRQLHLYALLRKEYPCWFYDDSSEAAFLPDGIRSVFLPISGLYPDIVPLTDKLAEDAVIFAGSGAGVTHDTRRRVVELLRDEEFVLANAEITAEKALIYALSLCSAALSQSCVAVIGGGRIAMGLVKRLSALGAGRILVLCRSEAQRAAAAAYGAEAFPINTDAVSEADIIYNTVPAEVLSNGTVDKIKSGTIMVELASKPGFSAERASSSGKRVIMASGLPGKYAPKSAALLILRTAVRLSSDI